MHELYRNEITEVIKIETLRARFFYLYCKKYRRFFTFYTYLFLIQDCYFLSKAFLVPLNKIIKKRVDTKIFNFFLLNSNTQRQKYKTMKPNITSITVFVRIFSCLPEVRLR